MMLQMALMRRHEAQVQVPGLLELVQEVLAQGHQEVLEQGQVVLAPGHQEELELGQVVLALGHQEELELGQVVLAPGHLVVQQEEESARTSSTLKLKIF